MADQRNTADPERPAYDNPVGDKGGLVEGNNVRKPKPPSPPNEPQGHASDRKLGRKPAGNDGTPPTI